MVMKSRIWLNLWQERGFESRRNQEMMGNGVYKDSELPTARWLVQRSSVTGRTAELPWSDFIR